MMINRLRGARILKAYICIFVCCSTKVILEELACDLSSEAFLAALCRFVHRRGTCSLIFNDNGTNYVGANKYLSQIMEYAIKNKCFIWHFIPWSAPHCDRLFEADIKSIKTHLYTVLVEIEAILNSCFLCP